MKKLIFAFLILASANSFGQGIFKRLSFGLKAGANYSNFANADFKTDGLVGFHAGAMVNFKLNDHFSIQEEFLFSSEGAKIKDGVFANQKINIYYVNVPILLRYRTTSGLYLEAGAQANVRAKEDIDNYQGDFAEQVDFGVVGGLGYQSKMGLGIGIRYYEGLSKVSKVEISNVKPEFRNSVAQASIFYVF